MRTSILFAALASVIGGLSIQAESYAADCPSIGPQIIGKTQVYFSGGKTCKLMVSSAAPSGDYRQYLFNELGLVEVVTVFSGPGKVSQNMGVRAYFVFPRKQTPSYTVLTHGDIEVRAANNQIFRFDPETAHLKPIESLKFTDRAMLKSNQGGFEFQSMGGLFLDSGFNFGGPAFAKSGRTSTFKDSVGGTCVVKNGELFTSGDEPRLKFSTDIELKNFLIGRCPDLEVSVLNPPPFFPARRVDTPPSATAPAAQ